MEEKVKELQKTDMSRDCFLTWCETVTAGRSEKLKNRPHKEIKEEIVVGGGGGGFSCFYKKLLHWKQSHMVLNIFLGQFSGIMKRWNIHSFTNINQFLFQRTQIIVHCAHMKLYARHLISKQC
jgi:hypothetical protein